MQKYSESDIAAFIAEQELIARLEENYKINGARQEGHAEGLAEGHAEGLAEGKEQTQMSNIQNMLKLGLEEEKIKELLNVDDELICKAKTSM